MPETDTDLQWLVAQQPGRLESDPAARERALAALRQHAAPPRRSPSRPSRPLAARIGLASTAGVAAIAAAVGLSLGSGAHHSAASRPSAKPSAKPSVTAARHLHAISPLIRLAADVKRFTTSTGDATLVARTTGTGSQAVTVYDLYTDSGSYFFSQTESGLAGQVSAGDDQADGLFDREIAAAKEGASGDVAKAAQDMADAPDPSHVISKTEPPITAAEAAAKHIAPGYQPGSLFDNWVWEDSQDALIAGAGDPAVRAGVLDILATLPDVTVTDSTTDGQPSLILTAGAAEMGSGYTEQLTINADTGVPIQFVGGATGQTGVTVSYAVSRVSLSDLPSGN